MSTAILGSQFEHLKRYNLYWLSMQLKSLMQKYFDKRLQVQTNAAFDSVESVLICFECVFKLCHSRFVIVQYLVINISNTVTSVPNVQTHTRPCSHTKNSFCFCNLDKFVDRQKGEPSDGWKVWTSSSLHPNLTRSPQPNFYGLP